MLQTVIIFHDIFLELLSSVLTNCDIGYDFTIFKIMCLMSSDVLCNVSKMFEQLVEMTLSSRCIMGYVQMVYFVVELLFYETSKQENFLPVKSYFEPTFQQNTLAESTHRSFAFGATHMDYGQLV